MMSDACFGSDVTRERIEMFNHSLGFASAVSTQQAARPWLTCRCQSCRKEEKSMIKQPTCRPSIARMTHLTNAVSSIEVCIGAWTVSGSEGQDE